jgi:hypothetical protein
MYMYIIEIRKESGVNEVEVDSVSQYKTRYINQDRGS